jgi:hypothetical protein
MTDQPFSGIFPILVTPFDEKDQIDEDSLRQEVDFLIEEGVHDIGIALGSELLKMTEPERDKVVQVVISQDRGRVPVVINTGVQSPSAGPGRTGGLYGPETWVTDVRRHRLHLRMLSVQHRKAARVQI